MSIFGKPQVKIVRERSEVSKKLRAQLKEAKQKLIVAQDAWHEEKSDMVAAGALQTKKLNRQVEVKADEVAELQTKVKVLQDKVEASQELHARGIELDSKESIIKAKEDAQENFVDEIKKLKKQVDDADDIGYKKGYADGVSDGLRKATEITAEDRKQAMQVAMLSAASHTPAAAETIAKEMVKHALPANTGAKNKKA